MRRMRMAALILPVMILWAMFGLGAQLSSFAAPVTWQEEGGVWKCYDASGNPVTNSWKRDAGSGLYYYLDENGQMVRDELVEYNGNYYYVDEDGVRVTNRWISIPNQFGLWEEDVTEIWYYFGAGGKAVKDGKKAIDGKSYLFDEEGRMLSGWQRRGEKEDLYYLGADNEGWIHTGWQSLEPWDEMEGDYEAVEWFYFRPSGGKAYRDVKKRIDGDYYLFDENGVTKNKWNVSTPSNALASGSNALASGSNALASGSNALASGSNAVASGSNAVASGSNAANTWADEETGKAGKGWIQAHDPEDVNETGDVYWYYLDREGIPFNLGGKDANRVSYVHNVLEDYFMNNCAAKVIGGKTYLFNDKGQMVTGYISAWNVRRDGGAELGGSDWEYYYFYNLETEKEGRLMTGKQTIYDDNGNDIGHVYLKKNGQAYTTTIAEGRLYDPTGFRFDGKKDGYELIYLGTIEFKVKGSSRIMTDCLVLIDESGKLKKSGTVTIQDVRYTVKDYEVVDYEWLD